MANDGHSGRESTRREYLQYGGAVVAGGLLAGCTGGGGSETTESETETTTAATTESTTEAETETTTETSESYSVSIEPMGEVTFDSVPETWVANNGSWADMGVALGLDAPMGVWLTGRYHTQYYDEIPGVSVDKSSIRQLWGDSGVGKEQFYDMDADVHIADPNFLKNRGQWSDADVEEISTQVGPFFGNSIFSRGYAWHDDYRYYDLYEAFEKLSQVFQREDRFEAFEQVHDEFQANLASVVPGQGERPSAAVVWGGGDEPEEFYPYIIDEGTSFKHLNDLKVNDALAATDVKDFFSNRGAVDFETLLDVDPEIILLRGQEAKDREEFQNTVISFMENHEVASELTAVKNDDVYRAGGLYQGPITNLVVTDRLAQTLYDADERLFDAQRVSDIVNGDL
ncbi:Fe3+-hydroxamate ABC transporter substrate-binding protein [Haloferax sp. Atlit-6N]|uniref:ABC transporter substrate-binding protein n=1 Tax=Haloferax sp. Atlit-6N TaxID=2077205 RepID=UPI000E23FCD2|nr:ABC transporter substrate-binding protein [Haloferax sp. Atlit-6N]REA02662.1 Fe3+-hydroxamate ABC transporter substrate-binding protein [Haloferax sp. Atlit-6N]